MKVYEDLIDLEVYAKFYKDTGITEQVVYAMFRGYNDEWDMHHTYMKVITCNRLGCVTVYDNDLDGRGWKVRIK